MAYSDVDGNSPRGTPILDPNPIATRLINRGKTSKFKPTSPQKTYETPMSAGEGGDSGKINH